MAPVLELDRQTASFVRQLEEQRKFEKSLLVERVRGTKEGLESVFGDIKSRVAMLEKLNGSAGTCSSLPSGQCLVAECHQQYSCSKGNARLCRRECERSRSC